MLKHIYHVKPPSAFYGCNFVLGSGITIPYGHGKCVKESLLNYSILGVRAMSSSYSQKEGGRSKGPSPWLAASAKREPRKVVRDEVSKGVKSSWEESAEKFMKNGVSTVEVGETRRFEGRRAEFRKSDGYVREEEEVGEAEVGNGPRWKNTPSRFTRSSEGRRMSDRPEVRRWDRQENWGRKTWEEPKESSLPKMVGEGIYGVGPVLAALSAGRREFYSLYVQEGLDLSSNNKKKKDKKGFERILRMADKIRLNVKDVSKHDLNMISDNRPHQGLVLDASPLEMVGIKELEPVSLEEENARLWLALDEVTDPQNLGAIIRSAYFFGASGVVLCAKNSAPLSGVVSKASAGSLELMELRACKNMMQFLSSSAENGWRVLGGSVSSRAVPLSEIAPGAPTVLVLGSEGTGLRPLVERSCTQLIKIPGSLPLDTVATGDEDTDSVDIRGQVFPSFLAVESLNVSVAAGVMLHHLIGSNYDKSGNLGSSTNSE